MRRETEKERRGGLAEGAADATQAQVKQRTSTYVLCRLFSKLCPIDVGGAVVQRFSGSAAERLTALDQTSDYRLQTADYKLQLAVGS